MLHYDLYIDGKWTPGSSGSLIEIKNPATGDLIGTVPRGNREDVNQAVAAAKKAWPHWSRTPIRQRAELLRKAAKKIQRRKRDFERIITAELGMPIGHVSAYHIDGAIAEANFYADLAEEYAYETKLPQGIVRREPIGVVAGLTPWNYPLDQITLKLFPALAAGNCIVLKPSRQAPLCGGLLTELLDEAGCPAGVFNLVTGAGGEVGNLLARHPDVDMVSFTGSTQAGKEIGRMALDTVKKIALELGGKSAAIILEDADLEKAAKEVLRSAFMNTGQTCCAFTRCLIPRSRQRELETLFAKLSAYYTVGDPLSEDSRLGPLISEKALHKVQSYIQKGQEEGARLLIGKIPEIPKGPEKGWFVEPAIFTDVSNQMTIAREEIFGPVLCLLPYGDEEEAVAIANDSPYGLAGAVFGEELRAKSVAEKIRAGVVHINGGQLSVQFPFGGYKESGLGREGGIAGFEEYLEIKSVILD